MSLQFYEMEASCLGGTTEETGNQQYTFEHAQLNIRIRNPSGYVK